MMSYGGGGNNNGSISASSDVALSSPANGQVLVYNTTLGKWQNGAAAGSTNTLALTSGSGADNTSKINNAIAAANSGDTIVIPPGDWYHSSTIQHAKAGVTVLGYGARLMASNPRYGGYHITGNNATIKGLTHVIVGATARGNGENIDDCPFCIDNASGVTLEDLVSIGARDAQFFVYGATNFKIKNIIGRDSYADGLHMTGGSRYGSISGVSINNPGDDGVAVVSYINDSQPCANIIVRQVKIVNSQARGCSIIGGNNIEYYDVNIHRCRGSAYYVAHEQGSYNTVAVNGARIIGGLAHDVNWDPSLDTGAIGIFNLVSGTVMNDVMVAGIECHGIRKGSDMYCKVGNSNGGGGTLNGVVLQDINLYGTASQHLYADGVNTATITVGQYTYMSGSGTGLTTAAEGFSLAGSGYLPAAGTTNSLPGLTVARVRGSSTV